jgi:hypothetical protein
MTKTIILSLMLMTFAFIGGIQAKAQTAKRIQFAKGKTSATVKGATGIYGTTYIVRAKSGQKLILTLTPTQKVGIKVETDGRFGQTVLLREEKGGSYEVGLEESGDYTIFIGSTEGKSVPFTLTVKITNMTDI